MTADESGPPTTPVQPSDLEASPLFADLPAALLAECARRAQLVTFRRGDVLARHGEADQRLYELLSGTVEVVLQRPDGQEEFVDVLHRGDCVGDLALLLGQVRTATVRALTEGRAAMLDGADFAWLLDTSPAFATRLARTIAQRLQRTTRRVTTTRPVHSVAVVALTDDVDVADIEAELGPALRAAVGQDDSPIDVWAVRATGGRDLRRRDVDADVVLAVGSTAAPAAVGRLRQLAELVAGVAIPGRVELVLRQRRRAPYSGTAAWLAGRHVGDWHHVCDRDPERTRLDLARLARRVSGTAVGLVLSGGGARAFAHIGVIRALREAGVPIDVVGGASMGAVVAGQLAAGVEPDEMVQQMHAAWQIRQGLPDYTLPLVALRTGARTERRLTGMFGQVRIEDLAIPFVCVSSNLVTAESVVHDRGRLWVAVRSSVTVPGVLPPVRFRDALLVDGGLLQNLPVDPVRGRRAGRIIASDVSVRVDLQSTTANAGVGHLARLANRLALAGRRPLPRIGPILMRTVELASVRDSREAGQPTERYLAPPVDDVDMNHFSRLDEIVARGYEHAQEELRGWTI